MQYQPVWRANPFESFPIGHTLQENIYLDPLSGLIKINPALAMALFALAPVLLQVYKNPISN
jgi:hypothetical protein